MLARALPRLFLRFFGPGTRELGLAGERIAARALARRGCRVLARTHASAWGEIDLVFLDGRTLVCAEVKTGRAGPRFRPGMRLSARKLALLWTAARALARDGPHRVDLIEVLLDERGRIRIEVHRGLERPL